MMNKLRNLNDCEHNPILMLVVTNMRGLFYVSWKGSFFQATRSSSRTTNSVESFDKMLKVNVGFREFIETITNLGFGTIRCRTLLR